MSTSGDPLIWLEPLLHTEFFHVCPKHTHLSRNECNLYCLNCPGQALCCPCTIDHRNHRMVQIRRSSYHNVVKVSEIQKVLDITGVQTYVINSARVVFLNQRPQPKPVKPPVKTCQICDRSLLQTYRYCSLGCKLASANKFQHGENKRTRLAKSPAVNSTVNSTDDHGDRDFETSSSVLISPPTPPPTVRNPKRRKGIPQRAPSL